MTLRKRTLAHYSIINTSKIDPSHRRTEWLMTKPAATQAQTPPKIGAVLTRSKDGEEEEEKRGRGSITCSRRTGGAGRGGAARRARAAGVRSGAASRARVRSVYLPVPVYSLWLIVFNCNKSKGRIVTGVPPWDWDSCRLPPRCCCVATGFSFLFLGCVAYSNVRSHLTRY